MIPESRRRRAPYQGHRDAAREPTEHTPALHGVELRALAQRIAPLVAAELVKMLSGATAPSTYSTRREGPCPPEFTNRLTNRGLAVRELQAAPRPDLRASWSPMQLAEDLDLRLTRKAGSQ